MFKKAIKLIEVLHTLYFFKINIRAKNKRKK